MLILKRIIIVLLGFFVGCMSTWVALPQTDNVPSKQSTACDPDSPFPQLIKLHGLKSSWQMIHNCENSLRERTSIVVVFFYHAWLRQFGDPNGDVFFALNNLVIEWKLEQQPFVGYNVRGDPVEGMAAGITLTPTYLWSYYEKDMLLCKTSLIHELMHIALWNFSPDSGGDADHEGPKYPGWTITHTKLINNLKNTLCKIGI